MSDISKAEEYLLKRLEMLSDEKIILVTKVNKLNIEIEQIDAMIKQIAQDVDTAFEIFSPRQKKNDFAKQEIDKLLSHKEELKETVASLTESANELEEDIQAIREALGQPVEINDIDIEDEYIESVYYEDTTYGMKILEQQENERSRIARDLHDSVVQVLTNLVHKCEICSKIMDVDGIRAKLELEIMSRNLREAISEMRNVIYDLRPMSFDDLGLNVTLESFINDVKSRTNMEVTFNVEGTPNVLPSVMQLTIFRIVQEATNNSIKHSKGKKLDVVFKYNFDNIYLNIKDDGIGIEKENDENKQSLHTGFGLDMMKERVALLNGKIEVLTAEDGGTSIEVIIPILQEAT